MLMWINWRQFQLQVTRMFTEILMLVLLVSFVPYSLGKNYFLTTPSATREVIWYFIAFYVIALVIPWLIASISFVISNWRYHRDTDNGWISLLKQRRIGFLKVGLFFERFVAFVLTCISAGFGATVVIPMAALWMNVLYVTFWIWMIVFGMLTFYRYIVHEAQKKMGTDTTETKKQK